MKKHQRRKEARACSREIEQGFEHLMDMLYLELWACTEYQAATQSSDFYGEEYREYWYESWQDMQYVLHKNHPEKHSCDCFENGYHTLIRMYTSFEKDIWGF